VGTTVGSVTVLTVGVVKGDAVDFDAVVTVVTSGVVAVVCDSVVNVVGLKVLSVAKRRSPQYIKTASPSVFKLLVYFACVLYYLGLWAAVSVVSTLSFQFITCDL